ncbi:MAG: tyrosine-type recombinase/integrase [Caulobacter sp.]|nr:tyrosine-type recombinase/integrase [Caulobacter sp.]
MSVYKPKKSRFWQYDFQAKGHRFHGSTGVETRRKAEAVERRLREEIAAGRNPHERALTLDEAAGRWWLEVGRHLAGPAHVERRIGICLRLLGKATPITEITTRAVSRAIETRRGETYSRAPDRPAGDGRPALVAPRYPVSNATVNADIIITLRRILRRARKTWEIRDLPEIDWRALTLAEPAERLQYYTPAQRAAWLAECDPVAAAALQTLLTYGLRLNEVFFPPAAFDAGEAQAVDGGDAPRLRIDKRKADVPHIVPLRRDDARDIAARAGRAAAAGLTTIWFEQRPPAPALTRVTRRDPAEAELVPLTYYGLQARLRSAARRAGIDGGRVIHGARHDAGTQILRRTGNLKVAQQLLGHKDIKSTLRYAHALEDELRAGLDAELRNSPEPPAADPAQPLAAQRVRGRRPSSS